MARKRVHTPKNRCKMKSCPRPVRAKGMCVAHYQRSKRDLAFVSLSAPIREYKRKRVKRTA